MAKDMQRLKIYVKSAVHSAAVQEVLFKLGYRWNLQPKQEVKYAHKPYLFTDVDGDMTHTEDKTYFERDTRTLANFDWVEGAKRKIILDGKTIEISEDSFQALKKSLNE
jgi:hypothetical protein